MFTFRMFEKKRKKKSFMLTTKSTGLKLNLMLYCYYGSVNSFELQ